MEMDPSDPYAALAAFLTADYRSDENRAIDEDPEAKAFDKFLAKARTHEDIEERLMSTENVQIGIEVQKLLERAAITESFKGFIVNAVRHAHASERQVTEALSPDRLGITGSGEIFDPEVAPEIEAQVLRGYLHDIIKKHVVIVTEDGIESTPIILQLSDYTEAMMTLIIWIGDYMQTYDGESPLGEMDMEAFIAAADRAEVQPPGSEWSQMFERFQQLREREEPGKEQ